MFKKIEIVLSILLMLLLGNSILAQSGSQEMENQREKSKIYTYGSGGVLNEFCFETMDPNLSWLTGLKVSVSLNHQIYLGGFYLISPFQQHRQLSWNTDAAFYRMQYYGLDLGYHFHSDKKVHLILNSRSGYGSISSSLDGRQSTRENIWVVTPSVGLEVNWSTFAKFQVMAGYRGALGVDAALGNNQSFSGVAFSISAIFGEFITY